MCAGGSLVTLSTRKATPKFTIAPTARRNTEGQRHRARRKTRWVQAQVAGDDYGHRHRDLAGAVGPSR
jgi:hypothetical protein